MCEARLAASTRKLTHASVPVLSRPARSKRISKFQACDSWSEYSLGFNDLARVCAGGGVHGRQVFAEELHIPSAFRCANRSIVGRVAGLDICDDIARSRQRIANMLCAELPECLVLSQGNRVTYAQIGLEKGRIGEASARIAVRIGD